jgi:hypothetical protein
MQIDGAPSNDDGEPREAGHPDTQPQAPQVQVLTDEEAFYQAQIDGFADLRARGQARTRLKP